VCDPFIVNFFSFFFFKNNKSDFYGFYPGTKISRRKSGYLTKHTKKVNQSQKLSEKNVQVVAVGSKHFFLKN
jgi:hypothetical protein